MILSAWHSLIYAMRLLTNSSSITTTFIHLLNKYSYFSLASAWAGVNFEVSDQLLKKLRNARHVVVGTHFYQTHPEFIRRARQFKAVKFVLNTDGVFHPKVYAFYNDPSDWSLLIGSANFTSGAFGKNREALVEISSTDVGDDNIFTDAMHFIKQCWDDANTISEEGYLEYLEKWRSSQWHRNKLAGDKVVNIEIDPALTQFQRLDWNSYVRKLLTQKERVTSRLALLDHAADKFVKEPNFGNWNLEDKLLIAGVSSSGLQGIHALWAHLGTTYRQTNFRQYLDNGNSWVCRAINAIPLNAEVTKADFHEFKRCFIRVYGETSITSASRLLALKRPDTFFCYTKENRNKFSDLFKIYPSTVNLNTYWERIVIKIRESNWYNSPTPHTPLEGRISFAKAAILDAICYNH